MRFHEFSWKNIKLTKFTLFQAQMWNSTIIHALSWIFMKKYQTLKIHTFLSSDVRFKYYSCAFMNFHEKISNFEKFTLFQVQMLDSSIIHALSWIFMKKYQTQKSSHFSKFRCEIQVLFMRFHEFSWKNIKLWKIHTFPSSDVRFKYYSCAFMNFHEKYQTHKVHTFPSSDVRFKYYSCAFINFHEILNFQSSHFSKFRCEIQLLFMRFHEFSWKNIKLKSSHFFKFRCEIQVLFMRFHEFSWKNIKL
jgi:hypothetical protein